MTLSFAIMSYADDVSKATEIVPIDVTNYEDTTQQTSWMIDVDIMEDYNTNGKATSYYKFTLDKPAYVVFKAYADISMRSHEVLYYSQTGVFTEQVLSNPGEIRYSECLLEPGTYYIKYEAVREGSFLADKDSQMLLSVFKQDLERTGNTKAYSVSDAIDINDGKYGKSTAYGVMSDVAEYQWFRFDVKSKSDVSVDVASLWDNSGIFGATVYKYAGESKELEKIDSAYGLKNLDDKFTLEAGTYYISIDRTEGTTGQIKMVIDVKDIYAPASPKTKSYKSGTKYIKGNAEAGSTIYAKIGKKTYKAVTDKYGVFKIKTPALKVGNKISVYAKDENGNKSTTTKLTVKNRKLASPKVKTAKRNTKIVKGTAKKGLTVYVNYKGKTVKKKLTSKNYSIKLREKLTKGTKVKQSLQQNRHITRQTIRRVRPW